MSELFRRISISFDQVQLGTLYQKLKVVRIQQIFSLRIGAISAIFQFRLQQSWLMHIFCNVNALTASKVNNLGIFRRFIGRINTDK